MSIFYTPHSAYISALTATRGVGTIHQSVRRRHR